MAETSVLDQLPECVVVHSDISQPLENVNLHYYEVSQIYTIKHSAVQVYRVIVSIYFTYVSYASFSH